MPNLQTITHDHDARLRQIADILDIPIEAFYAEPEAEDADDLLSLLRLWAGVSDIQARRRVLSFARQEAGRAVACPHSVARVRS